ncbi:cell division ATPase MinD [Halorubrum sp. DTA98]|uniref:cell division ATPase MinD n=1 Tax=Halorubrum sp. DTA98 TaxID=3402163 RepID=UPI003AAF73E2
MATVYAVASAKGGVGKTTTTAALATILSEAGADVVAVDADIGMANLAGALGVTVGDTTVHDVLAGRADPFDAIHEGPAGVRVVPGETDLDAYAAADPSRIREVVNAFPGVDYVLVDAGAGLSQDSSLPLALADETLLVSTPERGALGDTEKTRQLTERLGGSVAGAAITRVDPDDPEPQLVSDLLDADVLGQIPEDDSVSRAGRANEPLVTFSPTAPATAAYRDLARALTGESIADPEPAGTPAEATTAAVGSASTADAESDEDPVSDEGSEPDGDTEPDAEATASEPTSVEAQASDTPVEPDDVPEPEDAPEPEDDIIVADDGPVGMNEAGDEEEIIVADSEVTDETDDVDDSDGVDEAPADSSTAEDDPLADENEPLAEDDADEPLVEGDADEPLAEGDTDEPLAEDDADEPFVDEAEPDRERADDADDVADELAGSVPFRDDDTDTVGTALAEEAEGGDDAVDDGTDEDDGTDGGGFFSRLLGR